MSLLPDGPFGGCRDLALPSSSRPGVLTAEPYGLATNYTPLWPERPDHPSTQDSPRRRLSPEACTVAPAPPLPPTPPCQQGSHQPWGLPGATQEGRDARSRWSLGSLFFFLSPSLSRTGYGPGLLCACWELAGIVGTHCGGRAAEPSPKRTCLSTPVFSFQSRLATVEPVPHPQGGEPHGTLASPPPDGNLCLALKTPQFFVH